MIGFDITFRIGSAERTGVTLTQCCLCSGLARPFIIPGTSIIQGGRGLRHGQLYRLGKFEEVGADDLRFFRVALHFDPDDLARWECSVCETPKERWLDALTVPVRWEWMIEEMLLAEGGGLATPLTIIPGNTASCGSGASSITRMRSWTCV